MMGMKGVVASAREENHRGGIYRMDHRWNGYHRSSLQQVAGLRTVLELQRQAQVSCGGTTRACAWCQPMWPLRPMF